MKKKSAPSFKPVGQLVKRQREALGMNQNNLADALGYQNCQFISNIERGLANIPLRKIADFSRLLKIPENQLRDVVLGVKIGSAADTSLSKGMALSKIAAVELGYNPIWNRVEGRLKHASPTVKDSFMKFIETHVGLEKKHLKDLREVLS